MNDDSLYEIAQALAPFLPGWSLNWDPANRPRCALFTKAEGACPEPVERACPEPAAGACPELAEGAGFYVEVDRRANPARLVVHGRYPAPFYPSPERDPRITISSARPVSNTAADIQCRFIPAYLEAYAQARQRQRRAEEIERQEAAILAELAAILDERVGGDGVIRYRSQWGGRYTYGRIEVSRDQVRLDLSGLPVATAREMCRLLREIK